MASSSHMTEHEAAQVVPDPDPSALPTWRPRDVYDPDCKCRPIEAASLADREGWEGARHFEKGEIIMSNRCRWHLRSKYGCKFGEYCDKCHVHAWGKLEPDYSQIVPDPESKHGARKLDKRERAEKRARVAALERKTAEDERAANQARWDSMALAGRVAARGAGSPAWGTTGHSPTPGTPVGSLIPAIPASPLTPRGYGARWAVRLWTT